MSKNLPPWKLIDNDAQYIEEFTSEKKLRDFAAQFGLEIERSPVYDRTFYVAAVMRLPTDFLD